MALVESPNGLKSDFSRDSLIEPLVTSILYLYSLYTVNKQPADTQFQP